MALTYDQVTAITSKLIEESASDNIYGSNPLMVHLKEKGRIVKDGGDSIKLPIIYKEIAAGGSFANYDLLSTLPTDNMTAAEYDWKRYYVNIVVSRHDLLRNSGESAAMNLLRAKVQAGEMQMMENLGDDLFSANTDSSKGILGLRQMVKASGQAGNISSSDFAGWVADIDATTSSLTLTAIEQQILDATVGSDKPDLAVTRKEIYRRLWSLLIANQRFGAEKAARGGFEYLLVDGIPVFHDSHVSGTGAAATADNWLFLLNSRYLYLYQHSGDDFKSERIPRVAEQDIVVNQLTNTCAFATDNRRMHSAFSVLKG